MSIRSDIYYPDYLNERLSLYNGQLAHEKTKRLVNTVGPLVVCFSLVTGICALPSNDEFPTISEISKSTAEFCQISNDSDDNYNKLQDCFTPNLLSNINNADFKKEMFSAGKFALGALAVVAFGFAADNFRRGSLAVKHEKKNVADTQDNIDSLEQSEKTSFMLARITSKCDLI